MKEIEKVDPKSAFLNQFQEAFGNDLLPSNWDNKKIKKVEEETTPVKVRTGMVASIPMICRGAKCAFSENCKLFKENNHPLSHMCPYEVGMVKVLMSEYVEKLEVDINDIVEFLQVRDIVNLEVQEMRSAKFLAQESFIQENVVGISADGEPIFKKELHLAVELSDKAGRRKAQLLKQLVATREAKLKAKSVEYNSLQTISNVMSAFKDFERIEAEKRMQQLGIIEVDEYIQIPEDDLDNNE